MSKASLSVLLNCVFVYSLNPEDLKIFNLSSRALFQRILKKFSDDPKLLVALCQVRSDLIKEF